MNRVEKLLIAAIFVISMSLPLYAQDENSAKKMNEVLSKAANEGHWQVSANEVYMWLKTKQADFLVVDVRPAAKAYKAGHIPGAIHIPYNEMLQADNLKKLPKDKKIILICATGQLQNIPLMPLRLLGYDAYTMAFGYAAWQKGSQGGEQMKAAIDKANTKKYPMEK
ncbi:MAG: rhodanese-like domain-containing protein [Nitrospirae bacterium]|nr:MAG: rhodanese-like domain-containing protein [Nitrospirota bacterium]